MPYYFKEILIFLLSIGWIVIIYIFFLRKHAVSVTSKFTLMWILWLFPILSPAILINFINSKGNATMIATMHFIYSPIFVLLYVLLALYSLARLLSLLLDFIIKMGKTNAKTQ